MAADLVKLNTGALIPVIGVGTWLSEPNQVGRAVDTAIRAGYRHIDGALMYANEKEIGAALQKLYKEGIVKREELFITSKLLMTYMNCKEDVLECCDIVLKNLQTDYLDLFLIHEPTVLKKGSNYLDLTRDEVYGYDETVIATVWEAMEELVTKGKVKSIGVSNFTITKTETLLKTAKMVPAVNQVECHLYFQQRKLRKYLSSKGIQMQAYAPLGSPGRSEDMIDPNDPILLKDPVLIEIASNHLATPAQVCVSYLLHLGVIVLPKSVNESRIVENLKASRLILTKEEISRLQALDKNLRYFKLNDYYFTSEEELWDISQDELFIIK